MKRLLIYFLIVFGVTVCSQVHMSGKAGRSPEETVNLFVKMDSEGTRLTPAGWEEADTLFLLPSQPPRNRTIVIIAKRYGVSEIEVKKERAEFNFEYEELARIDSSLHFGATNTGIATRTLCKYVLVLTNVHQQSKNQERIANGENYPLQWRMDGTQPLEMHVTADAARQYLTKLHNETKDPILKDKAEKALAKLKAYK